MRFRIPAPARQGLALLAGAVGYVLKNALPEEPAEAITKVYAGKKLFSDEVQDLLLLPDPAAAPILPRREKEVLAFSADSLTSAPSTSLRMAGT